jgi:hypothetical protein
MDLSRSEFSYTKYFCEENVYRLLEQTNSGTAIFISNATKTVYFKNQNTTWDYHVVALYEGRVYDFDGGTELWGCEMNKFLSFSFLPPKLYQVSEKNAQFQPVFRMVEWKDLQKNFHSNRSHMDAEKVKFPPTKIIGNGSTNLFADFVEMKKNKGFGEIKTYDEMLAL